MYRLFRIICVPGSSSTLCSVACILPNSPSHISKCLERIARVWECHSIPTTSRGISSTDCDFLLSVNTDVSCSETEECNIIGSMMALRIYLLYSEASIWMLRTSLSFIFIFITHVACDKAWKITCPLRSLVGLSQKFENNNRNGASAFTCNMRIRNACFREIIWVR